MVIIHTNFGPIKIELDTQNTPITVENFLAYAREGFYDGTIFHRVVENFVIQGGGFDAKMAQKTTKDPIENEAKTGASNTVGTLAMARTMDPKSATSQFFINVSDNLFLDHRSETRDGWGYCVFAKVVEGLDIATNISKMSTHDAHGHQDVPVENVVIEKVEILENA
jgi:peptidyl-prolyl cis-trans isomerase B (cyclophilin B)